MNKKIIKYLRGYSYNVWDINRLLVSSFLIVNDIKSVENILINKYIVPENTNEFQHVRVFVDLLSKEDEYYGIEELIELFEFVISPADKEVNGAVYTPKYIREYIVKETIKTHLIANKKISNIKFGDIACGCGGFFKTIVDEVKKLTDKNYFDIFKDNIFGVDIQSYSIERTKILLSLYAILNGEDLDNFEFNLFQGNSLEFDWNTVYSIKQNNGFDIIVGNPPYVGASKLDSETKRLLNNWSVSASGKADLYIPFFEIGMENLNDSGILGYITVNTFYRSLNGRSVRSYFSKNKYDLSIIDFGGEQLFKTRSTYTCICLIGKSQSLNVRYLKANSNNLNSLYKKDFVNISYEDLDNYKGWHLNDKQISKTIVKIEATGKPLGVKFIIRNGFATLKNNIYVFKPISESADYFCFEKDGKEYKIEKKICRDAIKPNTLKSESEIKKSTVKIIFPYNILNSNSNLFDEKRILKILDEKFIENNYPYAYKYLLSQKELLSQRDKGERQYEKWYAFGRNQALTIHAFKLLFPYISSSPRFVFTAGKELLFYNGYAILSDSDEDLLILQKILMSKIFWFYIKNTSKPYAGNYFSLAKNYIKNFGICDLSNKEKKTLLGLNDKNMIDKFLLRKYDIQIK